MQIPSELVSLILADLYYKNAQSPFSTPDYSTLSACSLVSSLWTVPSQTLLFRHITLEVARAFGRYVDGPSRNQALLSHVRVLSVSLSFGDRSDEQDPVHFPVSTLVAILGCCPKLYELIIRARKLFSLDSASKSELADVVRNAPLCIRSLRMLECGVQSPILYEFVALFPDLQFLTIGVEITASPPPWMPAFQLYELKLYRTLSSEVLTWLLSASRTTLRILELRDMPGMHTQTDLAICCSGIQSLRLMRYNSHAAAILTQCTNLLELVLLNVPAFVSIPDLPPSLEHIAVLIQTYTASVDLQPLIAALDVLPRLRILTFMGDPQIQQLPQLKAICLTKNVALYTPRHKFWINDDPVVATSFPRRRRSTSNFYLMN
ncbi:hypothetical protein B0H15DRAFT_880581 [Mycena belliarum]|uniref:F-box domain-containing protein n=1 Tax=Mycena belliarum TaxID=1033014 RepID=A0AAD6UGI5_9AGAR|nr:hypothetical protein B0H15DRAFT_880581 [Mycena belliae]